MKKRILALTLALTMALCLLAGCGSKKTASGTFDENGNYVPAENLDVTIWYTQGQDYTSGAKLSDNVVGDWLYDKTKVNVKNIYGNDGGQWDTKLTRLIAGNNLPEIITCGAGQGPTHYAKLAEADKLWGISKEMLEKYAPNVLKRTPEKTLEKFKIGDLYYGLPYWMESTETTQPNMTAEQMEIVQNKIKTPNADENLTLWIRDDMLKEIYPEAKSWEDIKKLAEAGEPIGDELFDIPIKSTDEFVDFMRKLKNLNYKANNGKPVFAFGYSGGDNWESLVYMGGDMMGYGKMFYTGAWNSKENKVFIPLVTDVIKTTAKLQNKLLNEKVFDPESLVQTSEMYKEKVNNGEYAIAVPNFAEGPEIVNSNLEASGAKYRYRPFTSQVPTPEGWKTTQKDMSTAYTESIAFTKELDENGLIQLLNWVNVAFSDEFEEVYWWGPKEAGLYTEDADGKRRYKDELFKKRFAENDVAALADKDSKGIGSKFGGTIGTWQCVPINMEESRWNPQILNNEVKLGIYQTLKFTTESEHTKLNFAPSANPWDAMYSDIDEVVTYWAKREQWEQSFKMAFAASESEFDQKWQEAIDKLNSIVNIDEMVKKMNENVAPVWKEYQELYY
ncbi:MAG: hypothetical protein E7389_00170 [Ruminococcaceae bacterium]|nr:hypothetical protein [Oscillospiraceae bacterium]